MCIQYNTTPKIRIWHGKYSFKMSYIDPINVLKRNTKTPMCPFVKYRNILIKYQQRNMRKKISSCQDKI